MSLRQFGLLAVMMVAGVGMGRANDKPPAGERPAEVSPIVANLKKMAAEWEARGRDDVAQRLREQAERVARQISEQRSRINTTVVEIFGKEQRDGESRQEKERGETEAAPEQANKELRAQQQRERAEQMKREAQQKAQAEAEEARERDVHMARERARKFEETVRLHHEELELQSRKQRLHHLRAAAENLHAAGLHHEAERLEKQAAELERALRGSGEHSPVLPPEVVEHIVDTHRLVRELREEVEQLRREIGELREQLRRGPRPPGPADEIRRSAPRGPRAPGQPQRPGGVREREGAPSASAEESVEQAEEKPSGDQ